VKIGSHGPWEQLLTIQIQIKSNYLATGYQKFKKPKEHTLESSRFGKDMEGQRAHGAPQKMMSRDAQGTFSWDS
jgi:hypothetical protein